MTTSSLPARRRGSFSWLLRDAVTIAQRDLRHWIQQPANIIITWLSPVMIALMFGGLFGGAIKTPSGSSYYEFLMPGMFTLAMLFGLESTIQAVTAGTWASQYAIILAVLWPLLITAVFLPLSAKKFRMLGN